jgi:hypothetical protein
MSEHHTIHSISNNGTVLAIIYSIKVYVETKEWKDTTKNGWLKIFQILPHDFNIIAINLATPEYGHAIKQGQEYGLVQIIFTPLFKIDDFAIKEISKISMG